MEIKVYGLPELEYLEGFGKLCQGKYGCIDLRLQRAHYYDPIVSVYASWREGAYVQGSSTFVFPTEWLKNILLLEDINNLFNMRGWSTGPEISGDSMRSWLELGMDTIIPPDIFSTHLKGFYIEYLRGLSKGFPGELTKEVHFLSVPDNQFYPPRRPFGDQEFITESSEQYRNRVLSSVLDQLLEIENNR